MELEGLVMPTDALCRRFLTVGDVAFGYIHETNEFTLNYDAAQRVNSTSYFVPVVPKTDRNRFEPFTLTKLHGCFAANKVFGHAFEFGGDGFLESVYLSTTIACAEVFSPEAELAVQPILFGRPEPEDEREEVLRCLLILTSFQTWRENAERVRSSITIQNRWRFFKAAGESRRTLSIRKPVVGFAELPLFIPVHDVLKYESTHQRPKQTRAGSEPCTMTHEDVPYGSGVACLQCMSLSGRITEDAGPTQLQLHVGWTDVMTCKVCGSDALTLCDLLSRSSGQRAKELFVARTLRFGPMIDNLFEAQVLKKMRLSVDSFDRRREMCVSDYRSDDRRQGRVVAGVGNLGCDKSHVDAATAWHYLENAFESDGDGGLFIHEMRNYDLVSLPTLFKSAWQVFPGTVGESVSGQALTQVLEQSHDNKIVISLTKQVVRASVRPLGQLSENIVFKGVTYNRFEEWPHSGVYRALVGATDNMSAPGVSQNHVEEGELAEGIDVSKYCSDAARLAYQLCMRVGGMRDRHADKNFAMLGKTATRTLAVRVSSGMASGRYNPIFREYERHHRKPSHACNVGNSIIDLLHECHDAVMTIGTESDPDTAFCRSLVRIALGPGLDDRLEHHHNQRIREQVYDENQHVKFFERSDDDVRALCDGSESHPRGKIFAPGGALASRAPLINGTEVGDVVERIAAFELIKAIAETDEFSAGCDAVFSDDSGVPMFYHSTESEIGDHQTGNITERAMNAIKIKGPQHYDDNAHAVGRTTSVISAFTFFSLNVGCNFSAYVADDFGAIYARTCRKCEVWCHTETKALNPDDTVSLIYVRGHPVHMSDYIDKERVLNDWDTPQFLVDWSVDDEYSVFSDKQFSSVSEFRDQARSPRTFLTQERAIARVFDLSNMLSGDNELNEIVKVALKRFTTRGEELRYGFFSNDQGLAPNQLSAWCAHMCDEDVQSLKEDLEIITAAGSLVMGRNGVILRYIAHCQLDNLDPVDHSVVFRDRDASWNEIHDGSHNYFATTANAVIVPNLLKTDGSGILEFCGLADHYVTMKEAMTLLLCCGLCYRETPGIQIVETEAGRLYELEMLTTGVSFVADIANEFRVRLSSVPGAPKRYGDWMGSSLITDQSLGVEIKRTSKGAARDTPRRVDTKRELRSDAFSKGLINENMGVVLTEAFDAFSSTLLLRNLVEQALVDKTWKFLELYTCENDNTYGSPPIASKRFSELNESVEVTALIYECDVALTHTSLTDMSYVFEALVDTGCGGIFWTGRHGETIGNLSLDANEKRHPRHRRRFKDWRNATVEDCKAPPQRDDLFAFLIRVNSMSRDNINFLDYVSYVLKRGDAHRECDHMAFLRGFDDVNKAQLHGTRAMNPVDPRLSLPIAGAEQTANDIVKDFSKKLSHFSPPLDVVDGIVFQSPMRAFMTGPFGTLSSSERFTGINEDTSLFPHFLGTQGLGPGTTDRPASTGFGRVKSSLILNLEIKQFSKDHRRKFTCSNPRRKCVGNKNFLNLRLNGQKLRSIEDLYILKALVDSVINGRLERRCRVMREQTANAHAFKKQQQCRSPVKEDSVARTLETTPVSILSRTDIGYLLSEEMDEAVLTQENRKRLNAEQKKLLMVGRDEDVNDLYCEPDKPNFGSRLNFLEDGDQSSEQAKFAGRIKNVLEASISLCDDRRQGDKKLWHNYDIDHYDDARNAEKTVIAAKGEFGKFALGGVFRKMNCIISLGPNVDASLKRAYVGMTSDTVAFKWDVVGKPKGSASIEMRTLCDVISSLDASTPEYQNKGAVPVGQLRGCAANKRSLARCGDLHVFTYLSDTTIKRGYEIRVFASQNEAKGLGLQGDKNVWSAVTVADTYFLRIHRYNLNRPRVKDFLGSLDSQHRKLQYPLVRFDGIPGTYRSGYMTYSMLMMQVLPNYIPMIPREQRISQLPHCAGTEHQADFITLVHLWTVMEKLLERTALNSVDDKISGSTVLECATHARVGNMGDLMGKVSKELNRQGQVSVVDKLLLENGKPFTTTFRSVLNDVFRNLDSEMPTSGKRTSIGCDKIYTFGDFTPDGKGGFTSNWARNITMIDIVARIIKSATGASCYENDLPLSRPNFGVISCGHAMTGVLNCFIRNTLMRFDAGVCCCQGIANIERCWECNRVETEGVGFTDLSDEGWESAKCGSWADLTHKQREEAEEKGFSEITYNDKYQYVESAVTGDIAVVCGTLSKHILWMANLFGTKEIVTENNDDGSSPTIDSTNRKRAVITLGCGTEDSLMGDTMNRSQVEGSSVIHHDTVKRTIGETKNLRFLNSDERTSWRADQGIRLIMNPECTVTYAVYRKLDRNYHRQACDAAWLCDVVHPNGPGSVQMPVEVPGVTIGPGADELERARKQGIRFSTGTVYGIAEETEPALSVAEGNPGRYKDLTFEGVMCGVFKMFANDPRRTNPELFDKIWNPRKIDEETWNYGRPSQLWGVISSAWPHFPEPPYHDGIKSKWSLAENFTPYEFCGDNRVEIVAQHMNTADVLCVHCNNRVMIVSGPAERGAGLSLDGLGRKDKFVMRSTSGDTPQLDPSAVTQSETVMDAFILSDNGIKINEHGFFCRECDGGTRMMMQNDVIVGNNVVMTRALRSLTSS